MPNDPARTIDHDEEQIADSPRVPTEWPLERDTWLEYEHAKLRLMTATHVAVLELGKTIGGYVTSIGENAQSLHTKVDGLAKGHLEILGSIAGIQESIGQTSEHLGRLAGDIYGQNKNTQSQLEEARKQFDSMSDDDKSQDTLIELASVKATRARIDAERAALQAEKAGLEAAQARAEAQAAQQEAATAKAQADVAKAQADVANAQAAAAKAQSEKSDAQAALANTRSDAAQKEAVTARRMAGWKVATLVAAGPAVYAAFEVIYKIMKSFE